jgi:hypothetical protein
MRRLSLCGSLLVAAAAVTGSACSDPPTTPTTPNTPTATTETFTGTLTLNGAVTFPYISTQAGSTNATIKTLDPDASVVMKADGTGNFVAGETVFQGETLETATWTAVVGSWHPATSTLTVKGLVGGFTVDAVVNGVDSKAAWTGGSIATTVVGIALGTWSGTVCSVVLANDFAGVGGLITGVVQGQGSLCARVYDVGKLSNTATFTIEVTHY